MSKHRPTETGSAVASGGQTALGSAKASPHRGKLGGGGAAPTDLASMEPRLVHYTPPQERVAPTDLASVERGLAPHASRTRYVIEPAGQTT